MSQRIEVVAMEAVRRACGFAALAVGTVMVSLSATPFAALKAGGLGALLVTFILLLIAARADRTAFSKTLVWKRLPGHERPSVERAQPLVAAARRVALRKHALLFAMAGAAFLAIEIAGEVNLWLYPR